MVLSPAYITSEWARFEYQVSEQVTMLWNAFETKIKIGDFHVKFICVRDIRKKQE